ncbi:MAG: hypothetical protein RO009_18765 [Pseudorhodoplanes sp.]|jgi:hypothetical protein|nr:hypothetical protein [Pseudorhodoplanes sp.]
MARFVGQGKQGRTKFALMLPYNAEIEMTESTIQKTSFTVADDGSRIVTLEKAITSHSGPVAQLRLRSPTFADFMAVGDPTTLIVAHNSIIPHDDLETIKAYTVRLSGVDEILLNQLTLKDALAVREAIKDFFKAGSASTSTNLPTS